jgi:hypothetical protein
MKNASSKRIERYLKQFVGVLVLIGFLAGILLSKLYQQRPTEEFSLSQSLTWSNTLYVVSSVIIAALVIFVIRLIFRKK